MMMLAEPLGKAIANSLESEQWLILFIGWAMYWFKQLDTARRLDTKSFFSVPLHDFAIANIFEVPISFISCIVIAIIGPSLPTSLIDMHGLLAVFLSGYSSSSIVNSLLSYRKPVSN